MIRAPVARICIFRDREDALFVEAIEALSEIACQLNMLALVITDRDIMSLVEQDVAGHQDRVAVESSIDRFHDYHQPWI